MEALKEREKLLGQILTKIGPQDKDDVCKISFETIFMGVSFQD